jgi:hypothetical protein
VSYTKLNEVGKPYLVNPNYFICYLLGVMQTITSLHDVKCKKGICKTYSDSSHFSEQLSYIKHIIMNYGLKDINFTNLTHLQKFFENREMGRFFSR